MFIYFLFAIVIASLPNANLSIGPLHQKYDDSEDLDQIVYVNLAVRENFNYNSFPSLSCCPNNVTKFRVMELDSNGSQIQRFDLPFYIENLGQDPLYIASLKIQEELEDQNIEVQVNYTADVPIELGSTLYMTLNFSHLCNKTLNNDRYWSIKKVSLELKGYDAIEFNYQFLCGKDYYPVRFDWSNIILIIFESIIILLLSIFGKIYAFKVVFVTKKLKKELPPEKLEQLALESKPFQGFQLSWLQALVYMGLLLGALFISIYLQEAAEKPIQIIVYILCCICTFHFVNELFCAFRKVIPFFVKQFYCIRYSDAFALGIGAALIALYLIIDQIWILSNLISICILGSLIKLLKIKSLKATLLFFLPIMAVEIFCSIYLAASVRYEWDSLILRYFNTPLSAQIPYFRYIYKKKCAWVSIFNILFPGFFLGYVHRFDKHKQTLVYEIVSFFGLLIGLALWVIVQYLISFPLPTSIFTEVLMILTCTLIAFRRNELNLFWSGDYYDEILFDPFKNEMDKKSVKVISFFNMGVSKEVIKKYACNSEIQRTATRCEPFELVKANQDGELKLDSILFEGLYSYHEEYTSTPQIGKVSEPPPDTYKKIEDQNTQKLTSNPTFETNQRKENDMGNHVKEIISDTSDQMIRRDYEQHREGEPLLKKVVTQCSMKLNEPGIQKEEQIPILKEPEQSKQPSSKLSDKNKPEHEQQVLQQQKEITEKLNPKEQLITNKKVVSVICEQPAKKSQQNGEESKKEQLVQQQKEPEINPQKPSEQVYVSPARQKYQINQTQKDPSVDRFKEKQQLRQKPQSETFQKNLEFFKNQEKVGNYKAPMKK